MIFDSIVNRGEFFSDHYLDALAQQDLAGLRGAWNEAEGRGEETPRTRLRSLGKRFFAAKSAIAEGDPGAQFSLNEAILVALGFVPDRKQIELTRGGNEEVFVPVAHSAETHSGLLLVALDLDFANDIDEALAAESAGRLLAPILVEGGSGPIDTATDAVSYMFATDQPPRYVLLLAGGMLVLADRGKWAEGKFLAVDLDLALSRGDMKAKGELETIAALFSADALTPAQGQSVHDQLDAASHKHAVGVSEDLRDGIRQSIELLANEVIRQRKEAKLRVYEELGLAGQLTTQCLRFLYRLLFLLYAEARPELGILPLDHPEYSEGYGLDRLRDLALTELSSDKARNGGHIHESLKLLFRLVNDGYHHAGAQLAFTHNSDGSADVGLKFEPLHSELFSPRATPLLDSVRLRNEVLQEVLSLLLLSREQRGRQRGFISYAQLGINQLGAVYEGLMAYTGFFADEDLYEVARPGAKQSDGTWVVPVGRADEYSEDVFVTRTDDLGQSHRVRHPRGSFVFRLSGRDRQRSASYYTPEVLTACVVRHALAELLDQNGSTTPATEILDLTICEPALGSGAFLNEAINQLAAEYLRRRQSELDESLDPERYTAELQKVKAHLALHQCYGVDLNSTAVELAEVSLWLNAMHPGLQAPWFGLHLRRGNSLVGTRRATYHRDRLTKGAWLKTAPNERPLADGPIGNGEIHHFLLPAAGWAAVADGQQAKELHTEEVKMLKEWRKSITATPSRKDADRLVALARRVESLWLLAAARLRLAEGGLRRKIDLYGREPQPLSPSTRELIERSLSDPDSALARLRTAMDMWTALWFWPVTAPPPTLAQWLKLLEELLGIDPSDAPPGQIMLFDDLDQLGVREDQLALGFTMRAMADLDAAHPWLAVVRQVAKSEGFFHWELEFDPIFRRGGFDLQVGNPPWVRLDWEDDVVLAETDPWFGVTSGWTSDEFASRRKTVLADPANEATYVGQISSSSGLIAKLHDHSQFPDLVGMRTNLYMVFMQRVWQHSSSGSGVAGLLHPEGHFLDPKAQRLRSSTYPRLRRHWQFVNEAKLFEDIHNQTEFGVHIYGPPRPPSFLMMANVQLPDTIDQSLEHDGSGDVPGIKTPDGRWDRRPHAHRVLAIDEATLSAWAKLFDEPGTPGRESRLVWPHTLDDLQVLRCFSDQPTRLGSYKYFRTQGFNETGAVKQGIIRRETLTPPDWSDVVLQGPHFSVSRPFAKQPNPNCKTNKDYSSWDLEFLSRDEIPRTNYQRAASVSDYTDAVDYWEGRPCTSFWRVLYRRMVGSGGVRSLQSILIPPGPYHVDPCQSFTLESNELNVRIVGLWSSLPLDYLLKVSGKPDLRDELATRFPTPKESVFYRSLVLRTLRLNCLTQVYSPLWEELFDPVWSRDAFTCEDPRLVSLGAAGRIWTMDTPLRTDYARRQAMVELDALAALILGLSPEQLCAIYRTQFAVLRKYEHAMYFDANGRQVPNNIVREWKLDPDTGDLGRYVLPFRQPDREKEMRAAYQEFSRREAAGAL